MPNRARPEYEVNATEIKKSTMPRRPAVKDSFPLVCAC